MATRRYRGKTEAKALDGHAGSGLEVELGHPLKAQALIESHGGLHHVGSMQRQRLGSRLPRPPHALAHEQAPDPPGRAPMAPRRGAAPPGAPGSSTRHQAGPAPSRPGRAEPSRRSARPLPLRSASWVGRRRVNSRPVTVGLQVFSSGDQGVDWSIITAATLMTSAPLLVGFLLFQRQFVQSFMRAGIR